MKFSSEWQRLVAAARQVPAEADEQAPFGFSTRVAARGVAVKPSGLDGAVARLSGRALLIAMLVMVATLATNLRPVLNGLADDVATLSDPVVDTGDSV